MLISSGDIVRGILFPNEYLVDNIGVGNFELYNKGNTRTDINSNNINKTIYDPSPIHYRLPKSAAYTGFTNSNISGGFNNGLNYYTSLNRPSPTIFLHALGYRSRSDNSLANVNRDILHNTAGPYNNKCWTFYYNRNGNSSNPEHEEYREEAHTTLCDKFE